MPPIMKTFEKKAHFLSQHNFLSKSRSEEKNYELLLLYRFFRSACFSRKRLEHITMSGKKSLRLRNWIAEEFVGFLFFEKKARRKEEPEHCEKKQQIMLREMALEWGQDENGRNKKGLTLNEIFFLFIVNIISIKVITFLK